MLKKIIIGLVLIISLYYVYKFLFGLSHDYLGNTEHSLSLAESKSGGFYIGLYKPFDRNVILPDSSIIYLDYAWVESHWTYQANWLFQLYTELRPGYTISIPVKLKSKKLTWGSNLWINLDSASQKYSFSNSLWARNDWSEWSTNLNSLPDTIVFNFVEKNSDSSWTNYIPICVKQFKFIKDSSVPPNQRLKLTE
jgi:hypothetical protein